MSDKDIIYKAIINILDKELKKLHISMPSGISEHIENKVKPQIDALIESQGYVSKQKYDLTTELVKDLEKRIIELEKDL